MKCNVCHSTNITTDEDQGETVCECGNVIVTSAIVNNIDFNNSGNKSTVFGSFFERGAPNRGIPGGNKNLLSESGQVRLYKAYKLIEHIASRLSLPQTMAESAKKLYKIAKLDFDKNFVQGRQTKHVAAVVLYIVCRIEKKPHLLIDFADVLQTSLYSLGSTYLKLIKKINNNMNKIDIPLIDPSLFIHRFCAKLEFEEKTQAVATTALRMLQSMKRDWICTGRRPAGLCGAAILISARYHGFKRTTHQIVKVVKVCHETIRKRLQEFKKTRVAQLTMEEFEAIEDTDLKENDRQGMDPPAFIQNLLKQNKMIKCIGDVDNQMSIAFDEIEKEIGSEQQRSGEDEEEEKVIPSSQVKKREKKKKNKNQEIDRESNESLLSSSYDEEIQQYLLSDPEKNIVKSAIWHEMNKEWIQEQIEKERNKKLLEKNLKTKQPKPQIKPKEPKPTATTIEEALQNSKKLKHISSDAMNTILNPNTKN